MTKLTFVSGLHGVLANRYNFATIIDTFTTPENAVAFWNNYPIKVSSRHLSYSDAGACHAARFLMSTQFEGRLP